jgi:RNA polymerase sigma-70 factor (ECF subfamily)
MKANTVKTSKINKSEVMRNAWTIYKINAKNNALFNWSMALKQAWNEAKNPKLTLSEVYTQYYNQLVRFANTRVKNQIEAEDLISDMFEKKVSKYLCIFNPERANIKTWLFDMAKKYIIDYYRYSAVTTNKLVNVSTFVNDEGKETYQIVDNSSNANDIESNELSDKINTTFENLTEPYKSIAKLYFLEQKQYNEIAELLNIPLNTVKVTLMRAKAKLQEKLQSEYQLLS